MLDFKSLSQFFSTRQATERKKAFTTPTLRRLIQLAFLVFIGLQIKFITEVEEVILQIIQKHDGNGGVVAGAGIVIAFAILLLHSLPKYFK